MFQLLCTKLYETGILENGPVRHNKPDDQIDDATTFDSLEVSWGALTLPLEASLPTGAVRPFSNKSPSVLFLFFWLMRLGGFQFIATLFL